MTGVQTCALPIFEDLVRDIALACQSHDHVGDFMVASENFEAIHNHSAYAEIYGRGKLAKL